MTTIIVSSGQFQSNFTVSSGVFVDISSGGAASGDIILTGGTMTVFNGGSAVATQFAASAGTLIVASGGIAQNTLFSSDAASSTEIIQSGGMSIDTSVGDFFGVSGQFGDGGERVLIESGGIASATTINWYGSQIVSAGGSVLATLIQGGAQQILSGGIATGTVIEQSDKESFGIHQSAITSFGSQIIAAGGHADNSVIQSGGVEIVSAGGFTSATQIRTGGIEKIESGANVTSLTLLGGGAIDFAALAFTQSGSASIDSATDLLTVTEGAHSATLQLAGTYQSGFDLHLSSDGNNGTMLSATENSIVISSGFTASGLSIGEGQATNLLQILSGGSAIFNSIISNGVMQVFGGGTSVDDVVFTGGQEILWVARR